MKSDQLSAVQNGVQAVRTLSAWLLVAVLALYGIAIWLARGARRATLRNSGIGLALVGLLVLVIGTCSATTSSTRSRPPATSPPRIGCI
jgi:hypothetical protein